MLEWLETLFSLPIINHEIWLAWIGQLTTPKHELLRSQPGDHPPMYQQEHAGHADE